MSEEGDSAHAGTARTATRITAPITEGIPAGFIYSLGAVFDDAVQNSNKRETALVLLRQGTDPSPTQAPSLRVSSRTESSSQIFQERLETVNVQSTQAWAVSDWWRELAEGRSTLIDLTRYTPQLQSLGMAVTESGPVIGKIIHRPDQECGQPGELASLVRSVTQICPL